MENIDNMAKNSLNALSQDALTEEEQKKIKEFEKWERKLP